MNCSTVRATSGLHLGQPVPNLVRKTFLIIFIAIVSAISPPMYGQGTGSFSGTVVDKAGSNISGASVTATSASTGLARAVKTDDAGHYLIPLLPIGNYTVRVESTGFQTVEARDLTLQVDEARELNFKLALANVTTTVEVSATAVAAETTNHSLGQVITSQQVSLLPLNGQIGRAHV